MKYMSWQQFVEMKQINEGESIEEKRKKPGGSNAGKYKGVHTFCGPAGGAPEGSYPVNSHKRAVSAIRLAKNAPNPEGIKRCARKHL